MTAAAVSRSAASPWLPRAAIIDEIVTEAPSVATYRLRLAGPERREDYAFLPGQFNMLYVPGFGEAAISFSGPPPEASGEAPALVHTIREAGVVTAAIRGLGIGGELAIRGPYGRPWPLDACRGADVVLVAGGIGLAPLRPAIYALLARRSEFGRCTLLYGARGPENLLYTREFPAWEAAGLQVQTTVNRAAPGWNGNVGVVPLLVDRLAPLDPARTQLLACGPEVMLRFVAASAVARGVPADRIWLSLERHMQCAIALCGHCQLGTELVCRDGPVFTWRRIQPLLQIHDL